MRKEIEKILKKKEEPEKKDESNPSVPTSGANTSSKN